MNPFSYSFIIIFLLFAELGLSEVALDEFFSGYTNANPVYTEEKYVRIPVNPPFPFFGKTYDSLFVNPYGTITFNAWMDKDDAIKATCHAIARNFSAIAPYWTRAENSENGNKAKKWEDVSWQYIDGESAKARNEIVSAFPTFHDIKLRWTLIATWLNMSVNKNAYDSVYQFTLQAIITTDGDQSFVIFYYNKMKHYFDNEEKIQSSKFFIGFDSGDGHRRHLIAANCPTTRATNMTEMSNVNSPGKWVFRVDKATIYEPGSLCPTLPTPIDGYCHLLDDFIPGSKAVCGCYKSNAAHKLDKSSKECEIRCVKSDNGTLIWAPSPECEACEIKSTTYYSTMPTATLKPSNAPNDFINLFRSNISFILIMSVFYVYICKM